MISFDSTAPDSLDTLSSGRSENLSGSCADERRHRFKRQSIWDQRYATKHFISAGYSPDHLKEIWNQIIKNNCDLNSVKTADEIKDLLRETFALNTIRLISQIVSDDGNTKRLMLELQDGHTIEAVIVRHGLYSTNKDAHLDYTLCLSCQVGNNMDCTFCATGTDGLFANLTSGEILEQLQIANTIQKISRVAFMGMGEPLDNYKEVIAAIKAMTDPDQFGLPANNITISTVGIPERIQTLALDVPGVSLSLAIHSANQDTRVNLIPSAMMFPLSEIFQSLDEYLRHHSRMISNGTGDLVMIEYVLIEGINDSQKDATDLVNLIIPRREYCMINPSLFMPLPKGPSNFRSPSFDSLFEFVSIIQANNIFIGPKFADLTKSFKTRDEDHDSLSVQYEFVESVNPSELSNLGIDGQISTLENVSLDNLNMVSNKTPIDDVIISKSIHDIKKVSNLTKSIPLTTNEVGEGEIRKSENIGKSDVGEVVSEVVEDVVEVVKDEVKGVGEVKEVKEVIEEVEKFERVADKVEKFDRINESIEKSVEKGFDKKTETRSYDRVYDRSYERSYEKKVDKKITKVDSESLFDRLNLQYNSIKSKLMESFTSFTSFTGRARTLTSNDLKDYLFECKKSACPKDYINDILSRIDKSYGELKNNVQFLKDMDDFWDVNVKSKCKFCDKYGINSTHAMATLIMATTIGLIILYKTKKT